MCYQWALVKVLFYQLFVFEKNNYYTHNYHRGHDLRTFCPIEFQGLLYNVNCSLKIKAHILLLSEALSFVGFPPLLRGKHRLHWCFNNSSIISDHLENCYMYIFQKIYF